MFQGTHLISRTRCQILQVHFYLFLNNGEFYHFPLDFTIRNSPLFISFFLGASTLKFLSFSLFLHFFFHIIELDVLDIYAPKFSNFFLPAFFFFGHPVMALKYAHPKKTFFSSYCMGTEGYIRHIKWVLSYCHPSELPFRIVLLFAALR